jgi:hypothetical protein
MADKRWLGFKTLQALRLLPHRQHVGRVPGVNHVDRNGQCTVRGEVVEKFNVFGRTFSLTKLQENWPCRILS